MLELMDLLIVILATSLVSACICIISAVVMFNIRNRDVNELYASFDRLDMSVRGKAGQVNKQELADQYEMALGEAVLIMKDSTLDQNAKMQKVMALAQKYPNVAMKLAKKFGLGF